jgi:hypothetical protein
MKSLSAALSAFMPVFQVIFERLILMEKKKKNKCNCCQRTKFQEQKLSVGGKVVIHSVIDPEFCRNCFRRNKFAKTAPYGSENFFL